MDVRAMLPEVSIMDLCLKTRVLVLFVILNKLVRLVLQILEADEAGLLC